MASTKSLEDQLVLVHKPAVKITPNEFGQCYKLVRRLRGMYIGAQEGWSRENKFTEMRSTTGLEYALFLYKSQVAAFASYVLHDELDGEPCTFLWEIHVDQKFRRHGLGRRLLKEVFEGAKTASGLVMLRCFRSNKRARMFYENEGFESDKAMLSDYSIFFKKTVRKDDPNSSANENVKEETELVNGDREVTKSKRQSLKSSATI